MTTRRQPTPAEAKAMRAAVETQAQRPARSSVGTVRLDRETGTATMEAACDDLVGIQALTREAFGTGAPAFADKGLKDLFALLAPRGATLPSAGTLNAGLAFLGAVEAKDEVEAALGVQMLGTHTLALEMMERARQAAEPDLLNLYVGLATKLTRTYTAQLEALGRKRTGGKQTHEVRYVYVDARNSQNMIVPGAQPGAGFGFGEQPHGPTAAAPSALAGVATHELAPMRSPEPVGPALPGAGDEGEGALRSARREKPRRADGRA